jgi:hypothetical protein
MSIFVERNNKTLYDTDESQLFEFVIRTEEIDVIEETVDRYALESVLKAVESEDDIYNTIAGDVDDKVDSKSVEERVAAKLKLAKWKADRLEKEEKMKV